MPERSARVRSASVASPRRGALHHARRSVLLLLGFYTAPLHTGIARYTREADWALNDEYIRVGLPPVWWRGDGILGLITNPKDVLALKQFPKRPLVDFSKGWISDSMPAEYRASGQGRPRVYYDNAAIGQMSAERFLERGFRQYLGRSVKNQITEVRIERARKMLLETSLKAHEVARHCGFGEIAQFSRVFRRLTGACPSRFRREQPATREKTGSPRAFVPGGVAD
jgi:AraC-like DNA-binding protein